MSVAVELEWYEQALAVEVGCRREIEARRNGNRNQRTIGALTVAERFMLHIDGAGGELAAAKALGRYWDGSVNTFGRGDLGERVQVRTRKDHAHELFIRSGDHDDHLFVLVTGSFPSYVVVGWLLAADAKRHPEWLANHGGHGEAWFVPQAELVPINPRGAR